MFVQPKIMKRCQYCLLTNYFLFTRRTGSLKSRKWQRKEMWARLQIFVSNRASTLKPELDS